MLAEGSCGVEEAAWRAVESREMRMEPTLPGRPMQETKPMVSITFHSRGVYSTIYR